VRVVIEIEREYEMDAARILAEFGPPEKFGQDEESFLWESFNELCGWGRDQDHIDGTYVRLVDETTTNAELLAAVPLCSCGHPATDHRGRTGPCYVGQADPGHGACGCRRFAAVPLKETGQ